MLHLIIGGASLVQSHQVGNDGGFGWPGGGVFAVGAEDYLIKSLVGFPQVGGHEEGVVKVGIGTIGIVGASIKNALGDLFNTGD